ncbi:hypothetical protein [Streptomyces sp. NPDC059008]|uniref:hypothetical protein n=1 Tax=Streptomyces sp. NPDC059008 TaxID=3346693 RepID=UPI0036B2A503
MSLPATLSNRSVVLALQEITEDLLPDGESVARTLEEAEQILVRLLGEGAGGDAGPVRLPADEGSALAAGRRLLDLLAADEDTAAAAAPVLEDPPVDEQLAVVEVSAVTVVVFALVTWLQTKVHIKVHRQSRNNTVDFELTKEGMRPRDLAALAQTAEQVLNDGTGPQL